MNGDKAGMLGNEVIRGVLVQVIVAWVTG